MKKLIVLFVLSNLFSFVFAQGSQSRAVTMGTSMRNTDRPTSNNIVPYNPSLFHKNYSSRAGHSRTSTLITDTIGTAGNLLTIAEGEVRSLTANQDINSVIFIHRVDPSVFPSDNIAEYMYDISQDGGNSWANDLGVLDPIANNVSLAGRYPNATIYNAAGNTNPDSAYLVYLGAWLPFDNGDNSTAKFSGFIAGVAQLDNNPATYTENVTSFNNGNVEIAHGLCNGLPGEFWACDFGTDSTGAYAESILLYKGSWNPSTNDIVWSVYRNFTPTFNTLFDGNTRGANINMGFDPSGRYGWLVALADISTDSSFVYRPVVYNTTDGGVTWNGPQVVVLDSLANVQAGVDTTLPPTTAFDVGIAVDYKGNPHILTLVGAGSDYSIFLNHLKIYDFTLNTRGEWSALYIDSVTTFDGGFGGDTSYNRPQVSITPDGKKVIMGWLDSDPNVVGAVANSAPNLFTRIYDVDSGLADSTTNETGADPVWQDAADYATIPYTSFLTGTTIQIPAVVVVLNTSGVYTDPVSFYYLANITHDVSTLTQDITPPVITLLSPDCNPATVLIHTAYTDPGATALDNKDGNITANIVANTSNVNTNVAGTYYVTYTVSDAAGNSYTTKRKVIVVTTPNTTLPTVTLNGPANDTINKCSYFSDPGATAIDPVEGNITNKITSNLGSIPFYNGTSQGTPGTYSLVYRVSDCAGNTDSAVRTIVIQATPPVITFTPDTLTIQACGSIATGISAYDACLGPVGVSVPNFSSTIPGTYSAIYSATNGTDTSYSTRVIIVAPDTVPPQVTLNGHDTVYVYLNTSYVDTFPSGIACSGILSVTSNANTAVDPTTRGTYVVTYVVTDSAHTSATVTRVVIVGTEPTAEFGYQYVTGGVRFTDSSLYNPNKWLWNFGDNNFNSHQDPPIHPYVTGQYTVCLTATNVFNNAPFNKPADSICKTLSYTAGIDEVIMENSFNLYPNPTTGQLTLDVNSVGFQKMDISIFNLLGENMKNLNVKQVPAQSQYQIDLSSFSTGVYLVRIQTEIGTVTKKVTLFSGN